MGPIEQSGRGSQPLVVRLSTPGSAIPVPTDAPDSEHTYPHVTGPALSSRLNEQNWSSGGDSGVTQEADGDRGAGRAWEGVRAAVATALSAVIVFKSFPRSTVTVDVEVVASDGSVLGAILLAATLALADASIPLSAVPVGVSVCTVDDERADQGQSDASEIFVLDCTHQELYSATSTVDTVWSMPSGRVIALDSTGALSIPSMQRAMELARAGAVELHSASVAFMADHAVAVQELRAGKRGL